MPATASWKAYYERNKEEIKARMRERDAAKREALRVAAETDAQVVEDLRQAWRAKYARRTHRSIKAQIDAWLADPDVKMEMKAFLTHCALPGEAYAEFGPQTMRALSGLAYVRQNPANEVVPME
jgi:hypothetical protein